jgi:hypothetical protein
MVYRLVDVHFQYCGVYKIKDKQDFLDQFIDVISVTFQKQLKEKYNHLIDFDWESVFNN